MNDPEILDSEIWVPVVGYEAHYSVSSWGRVRSEPRIVVRRAGNNYLAKARIRRPGRGQKAPYLSLLLTKDGIAKTHYVHHLVLIAFVGPMPAGQEGCHGDRDPTNNRKDNLRWDTRAGNHADKALHGTSHAGERHPMAKLTEADVRALRQRVADGAAPTTLWVEFGVSQMTAYRAATGRSWSHL